MNWRNRIVIGDAAHLLRALPHAAGPVPLILFSPPYNLGVTTGGGEPSARMGHYADDAPMGKARGGMGKWSKASQAGGLSGGYDQTDDAMPMPVYLAWLADILDACFRALANNGAIYFNHKPRILNGQLLAAMDYVPAHLRPFVRQEIVWARAGGINFSPAFYVPTSERIIIIAKSEWRLKSKGASGVGDVWSIPQETNTWHPAPFPLALAERVLETTGSPLVVDPFMGSGTVGKAARRMGVEWIGFERSERYAIQAEAEINAVQPYHPLMREVFDQVSLLEGTTP